MQTNSNPDVHSFDEILDAKYGAPGTPRQVYKKEGGFTAPFLQFKLNLNYEKI